MCLTSTRVVPASLRVVACQRGLRHLLGEERVGAFLVLADRAGHPDGDREHEGAEEPDRLRLRVGQERRHPTLEDQYLADRAAGQRPPERGAPRARAGLLEVGQRREREGHPQRGTPTAEIDDPRDCGHVHRDSNVEPPRPGLGVVPPFEQTTHLLRPDDRDGVRPPRHLRHQTEHPEHQEQHERDRTHGVGEERG